MTRQLLIALLVFVIAAATALADDNNVTTECGEYTCHNGGTCVTRLVFHSATATDGTSSSSGQGQQEQYCDCKATATGNTIFAGAECEYEQTSFCTATTALQSTYFCVNHGECNTVNPRQGCTCPDGWTGLHCEHPMETQDIVNGDTTTLDVEDDMLEACGDDMYCHHGGKCQVPSGDSNEYTCDCSTAISGDKLYSGPTCQYVSTDVCSNHPSSNAGDDDGNENDDAVFCVNGGTCSSTDDNKCDCPAGWTGDKCDVAVENDDHEHLGVGCGDGFCYHGGTCVTMLVFDDEGSASVRHHCDCSTAVTATDLYAGPSCEHKATALCSQPTNADDGLKGSSFCTNGGTCQSNPSHGCDCPPAWTGLSCEFEREADDITKAIEDTQDDVEECGEEGVCLHGGRCVTETTTNDDGETTESKVCDCSTAFTETDLYAGPRCEHKATDLCTQPEGDDESLEGMLFCVNGGHCRSDDVTLGCICPAPWGGSKCELQMEQQEQQDEDEDTSAKDDEAANDDGTIECGDLVCRHGGTCVALEVEGKLEHSCNCATAVTQHDLYAGHECEYKATDLCAQPARGESVAGLPFCVNGGTCNGEVCSCPEGHYGPHCEFKVEIPNTDEEEEEEEAEEEEICHLQCQNGGTCAKGTKDLSLFGDIIADVDHLNKTHTEEHFEHCVCPDGWTGLECQYQAQICGDNDHICYHGSKCTMTGSGGYTCDCSASNVTISDDQEHPMFAGESCEHPATDVCVRDGSYAYSNQSPEKSLYFCVNHGRCFGYVSDLMTEDFPGCDCPAGWGGPHCELQVEVIPTKSKAEKAALIGTAIFVVVGVMLAGVILLRSEDEIDTKHNSSNSSFSFFGLFGGEKSMNSKNERSSLPFLPTSKSTMQFGVLQSTGEVGIVIEREGEKMKGTALPSTQFSYPARSHSHLNLRRSTSEPSASAGVGRGVGMVKTLSSMFLLNRQTSASSTNSHTSSSNASGIGRKWNFQRGTTGGSTGGGHYGRGYGIDSIGQENINIAPTRLSLSEEAWLSGYPTNPMREELNIMRPDDELYSDDDNDEQPFLDEEPKLIDMRII